ncbi:Crp/Fnr family transcriptional regulator [Aquimarina aquimarini]|uniref:Crp/Fnr family transcriptional regulator n=1 Tax=Aquimarina aquimarini TaxID=1191734 RepID=UPI000D55CDA6|nr:Crp/Fnr family transcriptional regulator [Aquimarina aquimarini]
MNDLIGVIESKIELSSSDKKYICSLGKPICVNKKSNLLRGGQVSNKLYFIQKGILRSYHISKKGDDLTSEIVSSLNFYTNFESFGNGTPSVEYIEALTDCELIEISKESYLSLFNKVKGWPLFCNSLYEKYIKKSAARVNSLKNLSAKERYNDFVSKNPEIVKSIPIKHLASYLGIKPQSLSRIRSHKI